MRHLWLPYVITQISDTRGAEGPSHCHINFASVTQRSDPTSPPLIYIIIINPHHTAASHSKTVQTTPPSHPCRTLPSAPPGAASATPSGSASSSPPASPIPSARSAEQPMSRRYFYAWLLNTLTGGRVFRKRPQLIFANHLCCFTSLAPLRLPSRVLSDLSSNRIMQAFPALSVHNRKLAIAFPHRLMRGLFDPRASPVRRTDRHAQKQPRSLTMRFSEFRRTALAVRGYY